MLIDCDRCAVRGDACGDCVVSVLFGEAPPLDDADAAERQALRVLADAGFEVTVLARDEPRRHLHLVGPTHRRRSAA
jgi:hypothetical protein